MNKQIYKSNISGVHGELLVYLKKTEDPYDNGYLEICTIDPMSGDGGSFTLPCTSEGFKEAENVINILQEWMRDAKQFREDEEWLNSQTKDFYR